MRRTAICLVAVWAIFAVACPNEVAPTSTDQTPPEIVLDVFGIPLQPGASSQDNPETIDSGCCDVRRAVGAGDIDVIAGATDSGGVKSVSIWLEVGGTSCRDADGNSTIGDIGGPSPTADRVVAESVDPIATTSPTPTAPPASVPDDRLVQYTIEVPGPGHFAPICSSSRTGSFAVHAEASNYADQPVATKTMTLTYSV